MSFEVILPKMGLTMEEGTVVEWLVNVGDRVEKGQQIANLETEKVVISLESPKTGVVEKIIVPVGSDAVEVGTILCLIKED
jgi:pyruvate dehydrogenase E2 component (dihydrolipoamide acetyltransferase)